MRKIFYKILHFIRNKLHKPRYQLSAKGLYACHYIIEKYINETRNDYNEIYEELVDKSLEKIERTSFFTSFQNHNKENIRITEAEKRSFAAQMTIVIMLYHCKDEDKQKAYSYITDAHALELIKGCIKKGLVF